MNSEQSTGASKDIDAELTPRVTVEIVFLNAEEYLDEAITSVFGQSFTDWEMILVDDGSSDGSSTIAGRYARLHPERVRCLEHPGHRNRGISASRNLGLSHARGELFALLDADDVWLPGKLDEQVQLMDTHPRVAMVYGATKYWYSWHPSNDAGRQDYQPALGYPSGVPIEPPQLLVSMLTGGAAIPCTTSLMARTARLEELGGFDESFTGMYEDQVLYAKLLLRDHVLPVDRCWDLYRQHDASVCSTTEKTGSGAKARMKFLTWLEGYLDQSENVPAEVQAALATAKWRLSHPRLTALGRRTRRLFTGRKS